MDRTFSGKTLEEAKQEAFEYFAEKGIDSGDVKIVILEQPVKKLFGTKGEYKVKASADTIADFTADEIIGDVIYPSVKQDENEKSEDIAPSDNTSAKKGDYSKAINYITHILDGLGADGYKIEIRENTDLTVLDIVGDNLGIVIGRRGETLDSLQYLTILAHGRGADKGMRIAIDCNGYREKRKETLESLAKRTSAKVIKQGRRITLEPMNPYERRIIHSTVSEIDGVYSNSIGEEPYRKVVISANVPKHRSDNKNNSGERRGDRKRSDTPPVGRSYKQSSGFSTSFEREYKRNTDIEISEDTAEVEKSTSLFGKIEL